MFNVAGSKSQLVHMYIAASGFTNGTTTLQLTTSLAVPMMTLANSGAPGSDFTVGAPFPIDSTTTEGIYIGNLNVTLDYNLSAVTRADQRGVDGDGGPFSVE